MLFVMATGKVMAQDIQPEAEQLDTLSLWKRFSFHTNALDWITATPNATVELDVSGAPYNRVSVLGTLKYNWNTSHTINPRIVYNYLNLSAEGRYYWHTREGMNTINLRYDPTRKGVARLWDKFNERLRVVGGRRSFLGLHSDTLKNVEADARQRPRYWRAYYVGFYCAYDKYTLMFGRKGIQGYGASAGVSVGYARQLYPMKRGSIDLEIGVRMGVYVACFDRFRYDEESACYGYEGTEPIHVAPFPVVHDVHVALVYRFKSAKDKYRWNKKRAEDRDKQRQNQISARSEQQKSIVDSIVAKRKERHLTDSLANLHKKLRKDSLRLKRRTVDSIADLRKQFIKDSIRNVRLETDSVKASVRLQKKEQKHGRRNRLKEDKDTVQVDVLIQNATLSSDEHPGKKGTRYLSVHDKIGYRVSFCSMWADELRLQNARTLYRRKGGVTA